MLFLADCSMRWNVGCDTAILCAQVSWSRPCTSFNRTASSCSRGKLTVSSSCNGMPRGLKYVAPGVQRTFLRNRGRAIMDMYSYLVNKDYAARLQRRPRPGIGCAPPHLPICLPVFGPFPSGPVPSWFGMVHLHSFLL